MSYVKFFIGEFMLQNSSATKLDYEELLQRVLQKQDDKEYINDVALLLRFYEELAYERGYRDGANWVGEILRKNLFD